MINLALFNKELRENRVKFIICFVVLGATAVSIPMFFEFSKDLMHAIMDDLSRFVDPGEMAFMLESYDNFVWSQWAAKNLTQISIISAIVLGMGTFAGEVVRRTAPFLVSKPLSRRSIYATKAASGIFLLFLCMFGSTLVLLLASIAKGFTLDVGMLIVASTITFAGAVVIYLGTTIFSILIADPVKAGLTSALFWFIVSVPGFFRAVARFSFFRQMAAVDYWIFGRSPFIPIIIFILAAVVFFEIGVFLWRRCEF